MIQVLDLRPSFAVPVNTVSETLREDTFNRADSTTTLGSTSGFGNYVWTAHVGTWGIIDNQAYTATPAAGARATFDPETLEDGVLEVDFVNFGAGAANAGLIFHGVDSDNQLMLRGTGSILKRDAGALSVLATSAALTTGVWRVYFNAAQIRVEKADGTTHLEHTLTEAEHTKYGDARRVGLYADNDGAVRFDNIRILGQVIIHPANRVIRSSIRRGRNRRVDPIYPSACTSELVNENAHLYPLNPVGPYFPFIRRDTQLNLILSYGTAPLNLLPQNDAVGHSGGWRSATNSTFASLVSPRLALVAERVLQVTSTATPDPAASTVEMIQTVATTAGLDYTFSAHTLPATTARTRILEIDWLDAADVLLSTSSLSGASANVVGRWTEEALTATAPVNATQARVRVGHAAVPVDEVHYLDALMLRQGARAPWQMPGGQSVWRGYAEEWQPHHPLGGADTVTVVGTDALRVMAERELWPSAAEHGYLGEWTGTNGGEPAGPLRYWPMDNQRNDDRFGTMPDLGFGDPDTRLDTLGNPTSGQSGRMVWDARPLTRLNNQRVRQVLTGTDWIIDEGGNWTIECIFMVEDSDALYFIWSDDLLECWRETNGDVALRLHYTDNTASTNVVAGNAAAGRVHLVTMGVASDGSLFGYLNGVFNTSHDPGTKTPRPPDKLGFGIDNVGGNLIRGEIGRAAVFDYRRTTANGISAQYDLYNVPWDADGTCGRRFERLLQEYASIHEKPWWPTEQTSTFNPSDRDVMSLLGGGTLLDHFRTLENTESGLLKQGILNTGPIQFIKRSETLNRPIAVVFSDSGVAGTVPYSGLDLTVNPDIVNHVTASIQPMGADVVAKNTASITLHGQLEHRIDTFSRSLADAKAAAQDIVDRNAGDLTLATITIPLLHKDVSEALILDLEPGQLVRIEATDPFAATLDGEILEAKHDLPVGGSWTTTLRVLQLA